MKSNAVAVALAVAGFGTSVAVAKDPPPSGRDGLSPRAAATERTVKLCHRPLAANGSLQMIRVSHEALETHMRHGDLLVPTSGGCPGQAAGRASPAIVFAAP